MSYQTKSQHLFIQGFWFLKPHSSDISDGTENNFSIIFFSATAFIITPIYKHFHEYFYYLCSLLVYKPPGFCILSTSASLPNNNHLRHSSFHIHIYYKIRLLCRITLDTVLSWCWSASGLLQFNQILSLNPKSVCILLTKLFR